MIKAKITLLAAAAALLLNSCSKDDGPAATDPVTGKGTTKIIFENYVGDKILEMGKSIAYINANGDSFSVTDYKYYISNIKLLKADGSEYAEVESYHLLNQAEETSLSFDIADVPAGSYTGVRLLLGVDSTRNVSGAQTGALDPIHGMFWTWSSGYIMAKIEGKSPQSSEATDKYSFHLGGFSGANSVLQEVTLTLPEHLVITKDKSSTIKIKSDVLKWFDAPNLIKFDVLNQVGSAGPDAHKISQNYKRMLSVTAVEN